MSSDSRERRRHEGVKTDGLICASSQFGQSVSMAARRQRALRDLCWTGMDPMPTRTRGSLWDREGSRHGLVGRVTACMSTNRSRSLKLLSRKKHRRFSGAERRGISTERKRTERAR